MVFLKLNTGFYVEAVLELVWKKELKLITGCLNFLGRYFHTLRILILVPLLTSCAATPILKDGYIPLELRETFLLFKQESVNPEFSPSLKMYETEYGLAKGNLLGSPIVDSVEEGYVLVRIPLGNVYIGRVSFFSGLVESYTWIPENYYQFVPSANSINYIGDIFIDLDPIQNKIIIRVDKQQRQAEEYLKNNYPILFKEYGLKESFFIEVHQ